MHPYIVLPFAQLPSYWLMAVLGALACAAYAFATNRGGKAGRLPGDDVLHLLLLGAVGAMVGAKLLGFVANLPLALPVVRAHWEQLRHQPLQLAQLLAGGLVFYGGLIGGLLAVWWYCRRYKLALKVVAGLLTPCIPLFHTFGRVGCFLSGCCWGIPVPWGIAFTHSLGAPNHQPLLPVQLFEAAGNLLLFVGLAVASRRLADANKWKVLPAYVVCYGVMRFVLEFYRGDAGRGVWLLSTSQWIALVLVAGTVLWCVRNGIKEKQGRQALDGK